MSGVAEPREIRPGGSTAAGGAVAYRLNKVRRYTLVRGRWLDCGCCNGDYAEGLRAAGASDVTGVDIDPARVARARQRFAAEQLTFVTATGESLPFPDAHFDGILLNEVLEHVDHQSRTLAELHRVLTPGGMLIVFSPNRWFPFEGHGARLGRWNISVPVPVVPWLPRRLSSRVMKARNYWPRELRALVAAAGFDVCAVDFAMPLFGEYAWMPEWAIERYRAGLSDIERSPVLRRFGVSTMVVARRPGV
jgi:ubiquinone/menaquinone biosynthesis C-methylase UbiE